MKKLTSSFILIALFLFTQAQTCFDFPTTPTGPYSDNTLYPTGSVILSSNDIDIIKPSENFGIFPMDGFNVVSVDSSGIYFVNQLDLDVSNVPYSCKELGFELFYNGFAVDGDTMSFGYFALPPLPYNGAGFTVDTISDNAYTVTGVFDAIHIFGSTSILSDLCVSPCSTTGIRDYEATNPIKVFPNPSNGSINLASIPTNSRVLIYNITGTLVFDEYSNSNQMFISLHDQQTGTYIIQICTKQETYHSKWVRL